MNSKRSENRNLPYPCGICSERKERTDEEREERISESTILKIQDVDDIANSRFEGDYVGYCKS